MICIWQVNLTRKNYRQEDITISKLYKQGDGYLRIHVYIYATHWHCYYNSVLIFFSALGRRASDGGANIHLFNRQMYGNSLPGSPGSQEALATVRFLSV